MCPASLQILFKAAQLFWRFMNPALLLQASEPETYYMSIKLQSPKTAARIFNKHVNSDRCDPPTVFGRSSALELLNKWIYIQYIINIIQPFCLHSMLDGLMRSQPRTATLKCIFSCQTSVKVWLQLEDEPGTPSISDGFVFQHIHSLQRRSFIALFSQSWMATDPVCQRPC